jgi:hypothetical protein
VSICTGRTDESSTALRAMRRGHRAAARSHHVVAINAWNRLAHSVPTRGGIVSAESGGLEWQGDDEFEPGECGPLMLTFGEWMKRSRFNRKIRSVSVRSLT